MERQKTPWQGRRRWAVLVALIVVITAAVALATWKLYLKPAPDKKASVEKMALPLPDMPSIAVLPFTNMSGEKEQEYFSDGITEDIISALSQIPTLFVIASQSTFTYKGKPVKIQQVGEDLGVRYVLEGSVQRSGDTLRVTAQLIDATTGHHLWSERYDREMKGIFALQDDITMKVITALQVKLMEGEHARLLAKGTKNLQAYLKFLQAREIFLTVTKEGNVQARRLLEEVIALDPQFAPAYSVLGWITYVDVAVGLSKSPYESYKQAFELAKKAVAMDDSFPTAHSLLGFLHVVMGRQYDKGIAECERAIALAPNSASAHIWMGQVLMLAGITHLRNIIRWVGGHPGHIFMLACDAFGVLPPISRLTPEQATYQFLSGYTAKVAGTERGLGNEPKATFSTCFGAPFLADSTGGLRRACCGRRWTQHKPTCWLINTGWTGGPFGVGHRIEIAHSRALLHAAMSGKLDGVPTYRDPYFGLTVPLPPPPPVPGCRIPSSIPKKPGPTPRPMRPPPKTWQAASGRISPSTLPTSNRRCWLPSLNDRVR